MAKGRRGGRNKNKNKTEVSKDAAGDANPVVSNPAQSVPKKKHVAKGNIPESVTMKHRSQSFRSHHSEKAPQSTSTGVLSSHSKSSKKLTSLQERMRAKLEGAQFRTLNEQLYTTTGKDAFERFSQNPSLFDMYHRGYREQVEKWPENPLTLIIQWIKERFPESVVADFGCGDAVLSQQAPKTCTVHSFDLVSKNERVTACDMAHVPLKNNTCDVAVFCLSLMGTNLVDYLIEAKRVLKKPSGVLKIAEVRSRIDGMEGGMGAFVAQVCKLGFKCVHKDKRNKLFLLFEFTFNEKTTKSEVNEPTEFVVPPCIYKRR